MRAVGAVTSAHEGAQRHRSARDRRSGERRETAVTAARRFMAARALAASALQAAIVVLVQASHLGRIQVAIKRHRVLRSMMGRGRSWENRSSLHPVPGRLKALKRPLTML